jgi:hypothetical protein
MVEGALFGDDCRYNVVKLFQRGEVMAKARKVRKAKPSPNGRRPERMKLTAEESLKRTQDFDKRKEDFIASIREGTPRGIYSRLARKQVSRIPEES